MNEFINSYFSGEINQFSPIIFLMSYLGGILSSLSPCSLGMLPVIVGYIVGYSKNSTQKTFLQLLFFIIGLSGILAIAGIIAAFAGKIFGFHSNPIFALLLASTILILGLNALELLEIPMPVIIKQMPTENTSSLLYPMILGGAFAFASSPCATPVLAGIMTYASLRSNLTAGGLMLFFYALGQGTIIFLAGIFADFIKKTAFIKKYSGMFTKFGGIMLIFAAIYIYLEIFGII